MRLYLVQHGHALSKKVDPKRALSERGRKDVERVPGDLPQFVVPIPMLVQAAISHPSARAAIGPLPAEGWGFCMTIGPRFGVEQLAAPIRQIPLIRRGADDLT